MLMLQKIVCVTLPGLAPFEFGTTPTRWLNRQRLLRSQELLEDSSRSLEAIAVDTGFGGAAVMRHHFLQVLHTAPTAYRRAFGPRRVG